MEFKKYIVLMEQIATQFISVVVCAESQEEAEQKALDGEGELHDCGEYGASGWLVEDAKELGEE